MTETTAHGFTLTPTTVQEDAMNTTPRAEAPITLLEHATTAGPLRTSRHADGLYRVTLGDREIDWLPEARCAYEAHFDYLERHAPEARLTHLNLSEAGHYSAVWSQRSWTVQDLDDLTEEVRQDGDQTLLSYAVQPTVTAHSIDPVYYITLTAEADETGAVTYMVIDAAGAYNNYTSLTDAVVEYIDRLDNVAGWLDGADVEGAEVFRAEAQRVYDKHLA